ncbi:unnamed protein product, partial [Aureobasidium mustum]
MLSRSNGLSKRVAAPRTTISNPESALDYVEELLYNSKLADTTSDLKRPRAGSGSALLTDETRIGSDSTSISEQKHIHGKPCPDQDQNCHYHHQLTQHCHIPWRHCASALTVNAIKQSHRTGGAWIGAPDGWNKDHESCLTTTKKCDIHAGMHGMSSEKQRNKKYPDKPRVRGRHSRGSGDQKKQRGDAD